MTDETRTKDLFPRAQQVAYLDTAAEGLPPISAEEALRSYFAEKSRGSEGRSRLYEVERETVTLSASFLGANPEDVALVGNASDALNLLANSVVWAPEDEIVVMDLEFPSNVLPWLRLRNRGVRVRLIESNRGELRLEDFLAVIGRRTRLVTVSQVSYKNGYQIPFLEQLAEAAHAAGAIFCVDVTQALGRVPVSVGQADYVVASSYKWTLGCHGVGIAYLAPRLRERFDAGVVGWYSVRDVFRPDRFEAYESKPGAARLVAGMPNFAGIYALQAGLTCVGAVGVERIHVKLAPLIGRLRAGLEERGFDILTPAAAESSSGIVSLAHTDAEELGSRLAERGVIVWAGDGRVRASVHLYNDVSDIENYLSALDEICNSAPSVDPSHSPATSLPDGLIHT